jgi:hypothetical protein
VRILYREVTDLAGVVDWLRELGARTVVLDVEPLVAGWDTDADQLRRGVDQTVALLSEVPGLEVVGFATNSLRHLTGDLSDGAFFVNAARKPLLTRPYRSCPSPACSSATSCSPTGCWPGASASRSGTCTSSGSAGRGVPRSCVSSVARCAASCSTVLHRDGGGIPPGSCRAGRSADRLRGWRTQP